MGAYKKQKRQMSGAFFSERRTLSLLRIIMKRHPIFIFVIGYAATAMLPLPKSKLSRKSRIIKFGNHFKIASEKRNNLDFRQVT